MLSAVLAAPTSATAEQLLLTAAGPAPAAASAVPATSAGVTSALPFANGGALVWDGAEKPGGGPNPGGGADRAASVGLWVLASAVGSAAGATGLSAAAAASAASLTGGAAGDSAAGGLRTRPSAPGTAGARKAPSSGRLRVRTRLDEGDGVAASASDTSQGHFSVECHSVTLTILLPTIDEVCARQVPRLSWAHAAAMHDHICDEHNVSMWISLRRDVGCWPTVNPTTLTNRRAFTERRRRHRGRRSFARTLCPRCRRRRRRLRGARHTGVGCLRPRLDCRQRCWRLHQP